MNNRLLKPGWPFVGVTVVSLLLITVILYRQTVLYLGDIWSDISIGEYAHGFLVLAISIYLINYNRTRLAKITPCPTYMALPLVFFSVSLWLVAVLVDVEMLQAIALLFVVISVLWAVTGHQVMKLLAFPLLFIGFAIPIWFPLSPILQDVTADIVFWVTRMVGVPAFRQENLIIVPGGTFSVEEACSGLRYLLAALTLGSLYAYLNYISLTARVAVVMVVAGAALLANILRVFTVVYLGYITEMQHPWVADHLMLGWYIFGGLIALLLFIDVRFYKPETERVVEADAELADSGARCGSSRLQSSVIGIVCVLFLLAGPAVVYQQKNQQQFTMSEIYLDVPTSEWSPQASSSNDWVPQYKGAFGSKMNYQVRGHDVSVFVAYYSAQKQGEEVINDLNRISNKKIWPTQLSRPGIRRTPVHGVLEQVIKNSENNKRMVWYWYNIGGQTTINKYEAKLLQLRSLLTGKTQAFMVAVSIELNDADAARKALQKIVVEMEKPLMNLHVTG